MFFVSGILVYKDVYLWCLANGQVYEKSGDEPIRHLPHIQDAAVLAVDWLTDTLYWASSKHNMVSGRRRLCDNSLSYPGFLDHWKRS